MPVFPTLERLKQEDGKFKTNLDYIVSSKPVYRLYREIQS
jgi:hypothetical protein